MPPGLTELTKGVLAVLSVGRWWVLGGCREREALLRRAPSSRSMRLAPSGRVAVCHTAIDLKRLLGPGTQEQANRTLLWYQYGTRGKPAILRDGLSH